MNDVVGRTLERKLNDGFLKRVKTTVLTSGIQKISEHEQKELTQYLRLVLGFMEANQDSHTCFKMTNCWPGMIVETLVLQGDGGRLVLLKRFTD